MKKGQLVLPYFYPAVLLFQQSWTEDHQVFERLTMCWATLSSLRSLHEKHFYPLTRIGVSSGFFIIISNFASPSQIYTCLNGILPVGDFGQVVFREKCFWLRLVSPLNMRRNRHVVASDYMLNPQHTLMYLQWDHQRFDRISKNTANVQRLSLLCWWTHNFIMFKNMC